MCETMLTPISAPNFGCGVPTQDQASGFLLASGHSIKPPPPSGPGNAVRHQRFGSLSPAARNPPNQKAHSKQPTNESRLIESLRP